MTETGLRQKLINTGLWDVSDKRDPATDSDAAWMLALSLKLNVDLWACSEEEFCIRVCNLALGGL
jgi:hypothetical protein